MNKKIEVFLILSLFFLGITLAGCTYSIPNNSLDAKNNNTIPDEKTVIFKDSSFAFQLLRAMGTSISGAADTAECISTAQRITDGNTSEWYTEWYATADRIENIADNAFAQGHYTSAKEAYLRASTYYRTAEFYLHGNPSDPKIIETWKKSRDDFAKAAALSTPIIEPVRIIYENTTLPGYFYSADKTGIARPTIILQTGFDGTQEELYTIALAANERGYNVLTFEGPGQGEVIREQGIPFRYDWEAVITPVVNYAVSRTDVMNNRLALYGISLGGYLAPRAAAYEHRIKVVIANGGVYEPVQAAAVVMKFESKEKLVGLALNNPADLDIGMEKAMNRSTAARWFLENGMYTFKAKTPSEFILKYAKMTMNGSAELMPATVLVVDSDQDKEMPVQAEELYKNLDCDKTYMLFTAAEGAGEHCQMGALMLSNQRIFDWLDETFAQMNEQENSLSKP